MLIAEQAFTLVLGWFINYRVTRLAILDTIFERPRDWLHAWLLNGNDGLKWQKSRWRQWLYGGPPSGMLFAGAIMFIWFWDDPLVWAGVACAAAALLWGVGYYLAFHDGPSLLGIYIEKMISCPYCLSVWVGIGFQLLIWPVRSIPLPAMYFLAVSAGGMVIYQYIDFKPEEDNELDE